jgi:hypothetical protein
MAPALSTGERRTLLQLALLLAVGCGGDPADPSPGGEPVGSSFAGSFELRAVDALALPAPVRVGFMGATMQVGAGALEFKPGNEVGLAVTGPLGSTGGPVTLSTGGVYVRVGPDSLRTATGLEGRVWGDTAEIRTTSWTVVGAHLWRYVRAAAP